MGICFLLPIEIAKLVDNAFMSLNTEFNINFRLCLFSVLTLDTQKGRSILNTRHIQFWPKRVPLHLTLPETTLYDNLLVSARRYPNKSAIYYYGTKIPFHQLITEVENTAGYLEQVCGVKRGDRVALYMQNSPQFVIAFHAILRVGAVVVPINPMNLTDELSFYLEDSQASVAFIGQELYNRVQPLHESGKLQHVIAAVYSDYLPDSPRSRPYVLADVIQAPGLETYPTPVVSWATVVGSGFRPAPYQSSFLDTCVLPYTSGTTGRPKGCIHTHQTVQANVLGATYWFGTSPDGVVLTTLPLFHVTGMVHSMLAPIYSGSEMVIMTRWNREVAAQLIQDAGCTHWTNIATMVVDFLANPNLLNYNLSSLSIVGGGGATLPQAVGEKLYDLTGVRYAEGYGLSETISQTHFNPPDRPKLQCMGIPSFDVDARVIDPDTLKELGPNEEGEVIVSGPQVFLGYWNRPEENDKVFLTMDDKRFFRTGDIGKYDEEGYFFMVDRVKRMINAAGFKVWPTEVETLLYAHPAVEQACVIGVPDERRGESVKAYVVLRHEAMGSVSSQDIIEWSKSKMAAYKYPRQIVFVDHLPMSGSGKILWRVLQEQERQKQVNA